jgi:hypothetical protein
MTVTIRNRILLLGAYILLVAVGVSQIWIEQSQVQLGYTLRAAESAQVELKRQLKVVEIELASRRSPQNLRKLAKKHGLKKPSADQIVKLSIGEGGN